MRGLFVTAAAVLVASGAGAWADCKPMQLESIPGSREAYFNDLDGSGGPSVGDKRGGTRQLHAGDGTPVGTQYWVNTVSKIGADGTPEAFAVDIIFTFDDGALFVAETHPPSGEKVETPESVVIPRSTTWTVHGGTGAYAGASGTLDLTIADGEAEYRFDIGCE